ncbi:TetR/AcrR family transcriptional regulator [Pseudonocardiaceae bacterium YIM PH 21723]|nr:TetR/AcrR family transcriptional regulator [Pseudonocardiaceae bacterium YIM PH 21723]
MASGSGYRHSCAVSRDKETAPGRRRADDSRRAILDAATEELIEAGADRASLRSIARRVGMSHQAVAYHFQDRRAVMTGVAIDGWDRLVERTVEALGNVPADAPASESPIAIGATYVRFARENPALFPWMISSAQAEGADPELIKSGFRIWQMLQEAVTRAKTTGWGGDLDPFNLTLLCWSIVHGLATLDRFVPQDTSLEDLLRTLGRAIIQPAPE